ncbi:hypothetical protein QBC44DRAFT_311082 [Cladorrhinum sp. PSN332]|nr:hypothetical protein QBC44DRAFT_311082 [Cladorrhinum sp. PSN332]
MSSSKPVAEAAGHFNILYFASASSYTLKNTESLPAPLPLSKLFGVLEERYKGIKENVLESSLVTVNLTYVDVEGGEDMVIKEGDEVAIIPPAGARSGMVCLMVCGSWAGLHLRFREAVVSFAIDISGSTYGATLDAEKQFIHNMSNLLSPEARFQAKVLPWDHSAHPIHSLARLDQLEDHGGTDPGAILVSSTHKAALKDSPLWFLMTDGLIPAETRTKFASDVAVHGIHGISCVVVIFGNPSAGPASCDISTKGTFNVLLKGKPAPVFDSSARWDTLPQVSTADFADVVIPRPQDLGANEMALQDSLVINMDDLFANRLSPEQIGKIFENSDNLESIRMTMQARNQPDQFRRWLQQQTINPDNPVFKARPDDSRKGELLFTELIDLVIRGNPPPSSLQRRLRAAYRNNMKMFVRSFQQQIHKSRERENRIHMTSMSSYSPIDSAGSLSSPADMSTRSPVSMPLLLPIPQTQLFQPPREPPGAPARARAAQASVSSYTHREPAEEAWGTWEERITDNSLRGLLYTTGLRATSGSFRGTCPLCRATDITLAWLFRTSGRAETMLPAPDPGGTPGLPSPGSHTRLAFPLAMGHFPETSGVLAQQQGQPVTPMLVCDPCSVFCSRDGIQSHNITAALPMVRFSENSDVICSVLGTAFEGRFAKTDLPQVFLSVLMLVESEDKTPATSGSLASFFSSSSYSHGQPSSEMNFDLAGAVAAVRASRTFREAVEWTARDLLYSTTSTRELSHSFTLPSASQQPATVWPLSNILAGHFEELDTMSGAKHVNQQGKLLIVQPPPPPPLLAYPPQGFVVILKLASLINTSVESRRRAAFRRLLYLICEELEKMLKANEHAPPVVTITTSNLQAAVNMVGCLIGKQLQSPDFASGGGGAGRRRQV